jgi:peptide deformylase
MSKFKRRRRQHGYEFSSFSVNLRETLWLNDFPNWMNQPLCTKDNQMALLKIARLGHPVLRQVAIPVEEAEIKTAVFSRFVDDMIDTMRESDGVGLAAPQVYASKRLAIVEVKGPHPRYPNQPEVPLTVLVNPVVVSHSAELEDDWEGCLSIPDLRGRVPRWQSLQLKALDRTGAPIEINASGFFARVIQHELDHLDGVIFLDRMKDLQTLTHLREFQKHWMAS